MRLSLGLTQVQLADLSGLRQATLSALENGQTQPHPATVKALAGALKLTPEKLQAALHSAHEDATSENIITQLSRDWSFLGDLDADLRGGLASSLLAEWTHSSTALEGNTITLGDTLFVLTEGLTISGKSLREHQELHGHSQALALMAGWTRKNRPIGINQLHQLHRAIQTGTTIDGLAPVGQWKIEPNGTTALTTSGTTEWHDYARPKHVPALTKQWLELLAKKSPPQTESTALHFYTDLHLGFVAIHPYADGNGRMARLLANVPVLRAGLPPLLIDSSQRRTYLTLLGDYSLSRGQPQPDQDLVFQNPQRQAVHDFFEACWQTSLELISSFHAKQVQRKK